MDKAKTPDNNSQKLDGSSLPKKQKSGPKKKQPIKSAAGPADCSGEKPITSRLRNEAKPSKARWTASAAADAMYETEGEDLEAVSGLHQATQQRAVSTRISANMSRTLGPLNILNELYSDNAKGYSLFDRCQQGIEGNLIGPTTETELINIIVSYFLRNCSISGLNQLQQRFFTFYQRLESESFTHSPALENDMDRIDRIAELILTHINRKIIRASDLQIDYTDPASYKKFLLGTNAEPEIIERFSRANDGCLRKEADVLAENDPYLMALMNLTTAAVGIKLNIEKKIKPPQSTEKDLKKIIPAHYLQQGKRRALCALSHLAIPFILGNIYFYYIFIRRSVIFTTQWLNIHSDAGDSFTDAAALTLAILEGYIRLKTSMPHNNVDTLLLIPQHKTGYLLKATFALVVAMNLSAYTSSVFWVSDLVQHYDGKSSLKEPVSVCAYFLAAAFSEVLAYLYLNTAKHCEAFIKFIQNIEKFFEDFLKAPSLWLQAFKINVLFTLSRTLLHTVIMQISVTGMTGLENDSRWTASFAATMAIITFLGTLFTRSLSTLNSVVPDRYFVLSDDQIALGSINQLKFTWNVLKEQFLFALPLGILIAGSWESPHSLRFIAALISWGLCSLHCVLFCYREEKLASAARLVSPGLLSEHIDRRTAARESSSNNDDLPDNIMAQQPKLAALMIADRMKRLSDTLSLTFCQNLINYLTGIANTLLIPALMISLNLLLNYFSVGFNNAQIIAITLLLGYPVVQSTVLANREQMLDVEALIKATHAMLRLESNENSPERRPLISGESPDSTSIPIPDSTQRRSSRWRDFFKECYLGITNTPYEHSDEQWAQALNQSTTQQNN